MNSSSVLLVAGDDHPAARHQAVHGAEQQHRRSCAHADPGAVSLGPHRLAVAVLLMVAPEGAR